MAKITWNDRTNTGSDAFINASIFNETKTSVNDVYDTLEARLGTTSSALNRTDLTISGSILLSGSLLPNVGSGEVTSSFDLGSPTAAWGEIYVATSSLNFVEGDGTITSWSKQDVINLKEGKSLRKGAKQLVNEVDDSTYVRMSSTGKATHFASDIPLMQLQTTSLDLGNSQVPVSVTGDTIGFTGSFGITGSVSEINTPSASLSLSPPGGGGFVVNDLLNLLANYGQSGVDGGTAEGDINLDGSVTVNDLLLLLSGFGAPSSLCGVGDFTVPLNINFSMPGPLVQICVDNTLTVPTSSALSIG